MSGPEFAIAVLTVGWLVLLGAYLIQGLAATDAEKRAENLRGALDVEQAKVRELRSYAEACRKRWVR